MIRILAVTTMALATVLLPATLSSCSDSPDGSSASQETLPSAESVAPSAEPGTAAEAPRIDIRNARRPLPGVLTGGQPTPEQIDQAAEAGYRTIVNTRSAGEQGFEWEADRVAQAGMRYVFIDTPGADGLTRENVERLAEVLGDPEAHPVMVHCGSGNRVGALFALKAAWIDGLDDEDALQIGLEAGLTRLEETTRGLLAQE